MRSVSRLSLGAVGVIVVFVVLNLLATPVVEASTSVSSGSPADWSSMRQASRTSCFGYVFRNSSAVWGAGHIAFGFVGARGGVAWGSVNGFEGLFEKTFMAVESDNERAMLSDMRRRGYDGYLVKSLPTHACDYDAAISKSMDVTSGWYVVTIADCASATHDVLRALGFGEGDLGSDWLWRMTDVRPNDWFAFLRNERNWSYRSL